MAEHKVLILEGNAKRRESLVRLLKDLDIEILPVASLSQATRLLLNQNHFSLFIASLGIPNSTTTQILSGLKKTNPHLGLIILSEAPDTEVGIDLLKKGIIDHITSAETSASIYSAVKNELAKRKLIEQNEFYLKNLRRLRLEQAKNIKKALELEEIYDTTLENLMTALDLRDVETFGHSRTVAKYSQVLAKILGIKDKERLDHIRKGALLHDIGKIAIPDSILKKPGGLSPEEWEKVKLHPSLGFGLIKEIKLVKEVGNIILYHHERYDGKGYPKGLAKERIPLEARIFALSDSLDAITSHRPYRKMKDFNAARKEILDNSSTQFDPQIVEAFCSLKPEKWEKIRFETTSFIPSIEKFSEIFKKVKQ
ncbi:MAG: HD domain-containing phosphohydrolase [Candidatus Aminicenantales bacterium]